MNNSKKMSKYFSRFSKNTSSSITATRTGISVPVFILALISIVSVSTVFFVGFFSLTQKSLSVAANYLINFTSPQAGQTICYDSDGGRNYYITGKVTTYNSTTNSILRVLKDRCDTPSFLAEYYCSSYGRAIGVSYNCTKEGKICSKGACISVNPVISCNELYSGQNIASDSSRFNIVFVGGWFNNQNDLAVAAKRFIDLDNTTISQFGEPGLMQIPVFAKNKNKFNFWYVNKMNSRDNPQIFNDQLALTCQNILPNRIIPLFIYPGQTGGGFPGGSYGRSMAYVFDCLAPGNTCQGTSTANLKESHSANLHEFMHTMPCLGDEYGTWGNKPIDSKNLPVVFNGKLVSTGLLNFWSEPLDGIGQSYNGCIKNAPWKLKIGNGCGQPGVIDCFNTTSPQDVKFIYGLSFGEENCLPGKDCWTEVACFEGGGYADVGIWRPTAGSLMRSHYYDKFNQNTYLSEVQQDIVQKIIDKGPAIGKQWQPWENYQLDCDPTTPSFAD